MNAKITVLQVEVPLWRRLFAGRLFLAVLGDVQDVRLVDRSTAQGLMDQGRYRWVAHKDDTPPPPPSPHLTAL